MNEIYEQCNKNERKKKRTYICCKRSNFLLSSSKQRRCCLRIIFKNKFSGVWSDSVLKFAIPTPIYLLY